MASLQRSENAARQDLLCCVNPRIHTLMGPIYMGLEINNGCVALGRFLYRVSGVNNSIESVSVGCSVLFLGIPRVERQLIVIAYSPKKKIKIKMRSSTVRSDFKKKTITIIVCFERLRVDSIRKNMYSKCTLLFFRSVSNKTSKL